MYVCVYICSGEALHLGVLFKRYSTIFLFLATIFDHAYCPLYLILFILLRLSLFLLVFFNYIIKTTFFIIIFQWTLEIIIFFSYDVTSKRIVFKITSCN